LREYGEVTINENVDIEVFFEERTSRFWRNIFSVMD